MFKYGRLLDRIKELYPNREKFAKALGISSTSLSKKLNGLEFKQGEIFRMVELLNIPESEIADYFFCTKT